MVKYLKEGDLVGTADRNAQPNKKYKFMWTRATDVTVSTDSDWKAHTFQFSSGRHNLTVTSPHLMIIWKNGFSYFIRADQVRIGHDMLVGDTICKVKRIKNHTIREQVAIETEDGTIYVNGILASGLCDHNPETFNKAMRVEPILRTYKSRHFGDNYINMCMDSVAWRNSYMVNNRLLHDDKI